MKIIRNPKMCYGCRNCELVCSFHHQGFFAPGGGSIKAWKNNRNGKTGWTIDSTCDLCQGQDQPLCVRYCAYGALSLSQGEREQ